MYFPEEVFNLVKIYADSELAVYRKAHKLAHARNMAIIVFIKSQADFNQLFHSIKDYTYDNLDLDDNVHTDVYDYIYPPVVEDISEEFDIWHNLDYDIVSSVYNIMASR